MLRDELLDSKFQFCQFLPSMSLNKLSNISKSGRNLIEEKKKENTCKKYERKLCSWEYVHNDTNQDIKVLK